MIEKINMSKNDKRADTVQKTKFSPNFFSLDIHKSMFINDLMITLPKYYVESWWSEEIQSHNTENRSWNVDMNYKSPKLLGLKEKTFPVTLFLSFINWRSKESSYRLKWGKDFSIKLAEDYPKSFVRSLEYHIWTEYYNEKWFSEYDVGGFKEQLQIKIEWNNGVPKIDVKELFRVREESQWFPIIFKELSWYLISDYLLSSDEQLLRRIQVWNWKPRKDMVNELNENNIYILLNRETKEVYFGETNKSLSNRYPTTLVHHCFDEWSEYCIITLPTETSKPTRLLIERTLIAVGSKLFESILDNDKTPLFENWFKLKNRKK